MHNGPAISAGPSSLYPCRDSNAGHRLRRPMLYPSELQGLTTLPFYHKGGGMQLVGVGFWLHALGCKT